MQKKYGSGQSNGLKYVLTLMLETGIFYVTWQGRIKVANRIKAVNQITLRRVDYLGLSRKLFQGSL